LIVGLFSGGQGEGPVFDGEVTARHKWPERNTPSIANLRSLCHNFTLVLGEQGRTVLNTSLQVSTCLTQNYKNIAAAAAAAAVF
jgi:hypothetical protein